MIDTATVLGDKEFRILILKNDSTEVELIKQELQKLSLKLSIKIVETRDTLLRALEEFSPDLILSDYSLPYLECGSALTITKEKSPDTPFIFVSDSPGVETAIENINGAKNYVLKESLSQLAPTVLRALCEAEERKRHRYPQEALNAGREMLAVTLESINDGIVRIDSNRRIELTNSTGREYLKLLARGETGDFLLNLAGLPIERILEPPSGGGTYHELIPENSKQQVFEVYAQSIKPESTDGGSVIIIRDVSKERMRRQRIETQERLAAIGQLAAGIAHNFNNTLTVIIGFSELLQRDPSLNDKARNHLEYIIQQGHRASQFVRQILDFTRQSVSERRPLDLLPLMRDTSTQLSRTIPEHVRISFDFRPGKYWVLGDVPKIHQVMSNLVLNAIDAMPLGGELRIELALLRLKPEMSRPFPEMQLDEWVILSVSDTGTGIAPEHTGRIFEPFYSTKEVGKGTGLGLSQVHGIVKQHDGFVDFASKVGKGTTFRIYLPAMDAKDIAVLKSSDYVATKLTRGEGEKILVVEDEKMVLETTKTMLEDLGYLVLTATNGHQALKLYQEQIDEVTLVITDMIMPEMDGATLFQALKEINPDIKVLVSTGYPQGERTKELLAMGVLDCVEKPTDFIELSRVVGRALGKKV